ncbi:MAG: efflux RND transporter periplasmic adaptor subunit [Woeseiaceae bacterium]|nr:efflux RND transporter periplasmic adaptor subunit [Woeseiaceae bacterium]
MKPATYCPPLVLTLMALTLVACGTGEATPTDAEATAAAIPVATTAPTRRDISATYAATATIDSEGDAPVLARVGGEVVELLVEEGDKVTKGQVLARLDGERLRLEMLAAKADLDKAHGEFERYKDLNRRGLVSEAMFDGLKYDVDSMQATYLLRKLNYEYSNIRATISGHVSERMIKPGQTVDVGHELFRVTETGELLAYLQIPQTELTKFEIGNAVTLSVDSMPAKTFHAHIIRISPTIDIVNGTFRATVAIGNDTGLLAPGMFGKFQIAYELHADALTIPVQALLKDGDDASVYVVSDGQVSRRTLLTGIQSGGAVEVLQGLSENDEIVVKGQSALREGSKVLADRSVTGRNTG